MHNANFADYIYASHNLSERRVSFLAIMLNYTRTYALEG